jgi:hypothetical protein
MRFELRAGVLALLVAGVMGAAASAQEKKETPKGRQLPQNWAKLGLSDEQKDKVYSIQGEYKSKIDDLVKQINELRKKEREALDSILTEGQRTRLKEILLERVPGTKPGSKPETKPDSKPNDKPVR